MKKENTFTLLDTKRKFTKYIVIAIVVMLVVAGGITYSLWQINLQGTKTSRIASGCFRMEFKEKTNSINLTNTYPMSDAKGLQTNPYTFSIKNDCTIYGEYYITLDIVDANTTIELSKIKVALDGKQEVEPIILNTLELNTEELDNGIRSSYIIAKDSARVEGEEKEYSLRMWIDEAAGNEVMGQKIEVRLTVTAIAKKATGDLTLAILIDGNQVASLPSEGNYKLESYVCESGSTLEWKQHLKQLLVNGGHFPENCSLNFKSGDTLLSEILQNNPLKAGSPNFAQISSASDTGLWSAEDEYGTSYYFRGNKSSLNNNVIFGGYQWKIIRITGEDTIKLIYNGACPSQPCSINDTGPSTHFTTSAYNSTWMDNTKYIGYMYDTSTNSTIKGVVDSFYNNLRESAKDLIADTIYCNDRTGSNNTGYGAYLRLIPSKNPQLRCPQKNDSFTKTEELGNKLLVNPIGLITVDEVAMAGGVYNTANSEFYLYTGQIYYTMSPYTAAYDAPNYRPAVWYVGNNLSPHIGINGYVIARNDTWVNTARGVRPVIALKSTVEITGGNGSAESPYIILE